MTEDRCVHEMLPGQCGTCTPPTPTPAPDDRLVWVLPTSEAYHRKDCSALYGAEESSRARDAVPNELQSRTFAEARALPLRPCTACAPDVR